MSVSVVAGDLSAEARTPWKVFILDDCVYFSRGFMNHLDHFHLLFPPRIRYLALAEIAIELQLQLSS